MCALQSVFTIVGSLLEVKFLAGPKWETHILCYRKRQKNTFYSIFMVYFLHFTMCLISPCSLSWLHMSTANFCTFHLMLLGNREGKYENSQEVFNSVRTVYQGLQLTYVFSLILSLLSFPSDLRYSKQGLCLKSVPKGRHLAQQRVLAAPVS